VRAATGESFDYTYDAVGNRLTQTTITNTTVYTYDITNRLINVGGVAQTWDSSGSAPCDVGAYEVGGLSGLRSRRLADILSAEIAAVRRACRREMTI
jgi:YD repeat-containing protein